MRCLPFNSSSTGGTSTDGSPRLSSQQSPVFNLSHEFTQSYLTNSYNEMRSRVELPMNNEEEEDHLQQHLTRMLDLTPDSVKETLDSARDNDLTRLVADYFKHSEQATYLCILLRQSVYRARAVYDPLIELLRVFPFDCPDNFTQSQCDYAYDILRQLECYDNPFPLPGSHTFSDMCSCYSQLKSQLNRRLHKSQSRISLVRQVTMGSALCFIGTVAAVAVSAVAIAGHAFVALVASPFCTTLPYHPRTITKKELAHVKQLDDSARSAFVLNQSLITIDCLVSQLHTAVEDDKNYIRIALERGKDSYIIFQVLKELRKDNHGFINRLNDLEVQIILCFNAVNRARSLLHDEINLYQSSRS